MTDARFFKSMLKSINSSSSNEVMPIEIRGDMFRALAIAIMDKAKGDMRLPEHTLKEILDRFIVYFPAMKKNHSYLSIEAETLDPLAFVLRQIAVDQVLINPEAYQELFIGLSREVATDYLRLSDMPLHPCCLLAVAQVLDLSITLSIKSREKELRAVQTLNPHPSTPYVNVTLQVQNEQYLPCVSNHSYFAALGQLPVIRVQSVMPSMAGTVAKTLDVIAQHNELLWHSYEQYRTQLTSSINDNRLSASALALLYIQFLPDAASNRLLNSLSTRYEKTADIQPIGNFIQQEKNLLINALAAGLSTGAIDEEELFDAMEEPAYRRSTRLA